MESENIYEDGKNKIHHSANVHYMAVIGKGNTICEGVIIREGVTIGDNNYIGPYCIIGDPAEKVGCFDKSGKVTIGNGNRFTKKVTIDSGTVGNTIIENNTLFLSGAHVGHDAYIRNGVGLACNVCIGGFSEVGERTNFGLGAVAHQRVVVPADCMVGANAFIGKNSRMERGRKYVGVPVRDIGENIRK